MKLITERTQVREVAAKWAAQYPPRYGRDPHNQAITKALAALDVETATAADVAAIIGNDSWCGPQTCHECGDVVSVAVQVGEEPDYESSTATLCFACVEKAMELMGHNPALNGKMERSVMKSDLNALLCAEHKKEHQTVVRVVTTAWLDKKGLHTKRSLNVLKRKSFGQNYLEEECSAIGAEEAITNIINLNEVKDGIYEVIVCNVSRDIETGYVDDWELKLIPFDA